MKRRLFKTLVALLAIAAAATGPARAQQTYSVTFAGAASTYLNTTVSDATMPYTVSEIDFYDFTPNSVFSPMGAGDRFTNVYVASGGDGKVSVSYNMSLMTITVTGAFEGTATIHCEGKDEEEVDVSCDITVACVASATPEPEPTETLLTTITATGQEQASYSTANVATVSFSHTEYGSSAYLANWGWWGYGWIATVTAAEGYTITKCIFYDDADRTATDSEAPFVVETTEEDKTPRINGTPIDGGNSQSKGIKKIEVYGYVTPAGPQMRTLTGVPQGWQVQAGDPLAVVDSNADGSYSIEAGQPVLVVPSAEDKPRVKSVVLVDNSTPPAVDLEATTTAWADGSNYAVPAGGLTYGDAVTVSGNVTLTLTEGTTLTFNKGISLAEGATLTVEGNGTMNVNGTNNSTASTVAGSTGTLVLTSGTLTATGGNGQSLSTSEDNQTGASGGVAINGNVTINGGTVTATGGNGGNLNVTISGGVDNTHAGNGGAAISGSVTVNAGIWTATNGSNGTFTSNGGDIDCSAGTGGAAVAGTVTDNR